MFSVNHRNKCQLRFPIFNWLHKSSNLLWYFIIWSIHSQFSSLMHFNCTSARKPCNFVNHISYPQWHPKINFSILISERQWTFHLFYRWCEMWLMCDFVSIEEKFTTLNYYPNYYPQNVPIHSIALLINCSI